jgi:Sulfotransferase family
VTLEKDDQTDAADRPVVLYLGGVGRSGSTILDLMLGQVPGFVAVGELSYLWGRDDDDLCGCGRRFASCPFWLSVGERAFGGWSHVDRAKFAALRNRVDRDLRIPAMACTRSRGEAADYVGALLRLYRGIGSTSGARVIVDSTKHPSTAFLLRSMRAVDLRIVQVVRDPLGVAYSWTKIQTRPGIAGGAMMDRYPPRRTAWRWSLVNAAFDALRSIGVPSTRVRYEDLVDRPAEILATVARLAGSDVDTFPFLRGRSLAHAETHTIAGNPMRFDTSDIQLRPDEGWRSGLPAAEQRVVRTITWPMRALYGYRDGSKQRLP